MVKCRYCIFTSNNIRNKYYLILENFICRSKVSNNKKTIIVILLFLSLLRLFINKRFGSVTRFRI